MARHLENKNLVYKSQYLGFIGIIVFSLKLMSYLWTIMGISLLCKLNIVNWFFVHTLPIHYIYI